MAELQVTIPYKVVPARVVFSTMCTLFPLWALIAPAALGFFIGRTMAHPEAVAVATTITACLSLLAFTLVSIGITAVSEDNRIHLSKEGMSFPPFLLPKLQF